MRALLLAAGPGTRLRPITDTTPKCLVQVHGKPLLDHWLDRLLRGGSISRVLINTHHLADQVIEHAALSRWGLRIDVRHEPTLLGTAGTILANREWFASPDVFTGRPRQGPFLVAHADNFSDLDPTALIRAHITRPLWCDMTMLTMRTRTPRSCGIAEVDNAGVVQRYREKPANPAGDLANGAVYIMEPAVIEHIAAFASQPGQRQEAAIDLSTEILPALVGRIFTVEHRGVHIDIGTPEGLQEANAP